MKKTRIFFGNIAVAALVSGLLVIIGCGGGAGGEGGGIPGKFKFTDLSHASPPQNGLSIVPLGIFLANAPITDGDGYTNYADFYTKLGSKVDSNSNITPTSFKMQHPIITYYYMNGGVEEGDSIMIGANVDFANPVIISGGEFYPGTAHKLVFTFAPDTVTFVQPEGINFRGTETEGGSGIYTGGHANGFYWTNPAQNVPPGVPPPPHSSFDGSKITTLLQGFEPQAINTGYQTSFGFSSSSGITFGSLFSVEYHGSTGRIDKGDTMKVVVPFSGITIPEGANAVRFEIIWDLTGIIERYAGNTGNANDDIFILKEKFWDGLQLRAFIE